MTHKEVFERLLNGEKVTKTNWRQDEYVYLVDGYIVDGYRKRDYAVFSDNERLGKWKEYKPKDNK